MKRLTDSQKTMIQVYRSEGLGYKAIAGRLSLSRGTVQSYCRRMNLNAAPALPENGKAAEKQLDAKTLQLSFGGFEVKMLAIKMQ